MEAAAKRENARHTHKRLSIQQAEEWANSHFNLGEIPCDIDCMPVVMCWYILGICCQLITPRNPTRFLRGRDACQKNCNPIGSCAAGLLPLAPAWGAQRN